jgi:hypothetical protein
MIDQLKAIPRVLYRPKSTLKNLPSDRLYLLAFVTPLYFGYARAVRTGTFTKLTDVTGNKLCTYAIFVLLGLVFIPLGALLVKAIIRLFGKRLTLFKLMNLYGYALIPRLLISIPLSIYVNFLMADDTKLFMILGEFPSWFIIAAFIGGVVYIYCIVLYIYGIVISPSTPKEIWVVPGSSGPVATER